MTSSTSTTTRYAEAAIEAVPDLPIVRITRDFRATPAQLMRAHTDPELFVRWIGPDAVTARIDQWDCRTLGSYRYVCEHDGVDHGFRGTFPEVGDDRIVQTFTWEGMPEAIVQTFTYEGMPDSTSLERVVFEDLGNGRTRLTGTSLVDSFEARDAFVASGMEHGVREGYERLDDVLAQLT